jgi:hypothetical protein
MQPDEAHMAETWIEETPVRQLGGSGFRVVRVNLARVRSPFQDIVVF